MFKLLQELKRPSSCPSKKLKNINGSLKLDISPCPTDDVKQCLTADLLPLLSYDVACMEFYNMNYLIKSIKLLYFI